jgi:hypothetical protein
LAKFTPTFTLCLRDVAGTAWGDAAVYWTGRSREPINMF